MAQPIVLVPLGFVLIALGLAERGWPLLLVWLGADFVALGVAHARAAHGLFGKRPDGTLPWWSWILFLPMHAFTLTVWHLVRAFGREPVVAVVTERLVVGRRLLGPEFRGDFANIVDLTAEFAEPAPLRNSPGYRCLPILDGSAPTPEALRAAVASLRPGRTFVHCAQGHGRTGLFALALLVASGEAASVEEGLQLLAAVRPDIRLSPAQDRCLRS